MPCGSKYRPSVNLRCTQRGCPRMFRSESGRTNHVRTAHSRFDGHRLPGNRPEVIPESPTSSSASLASGSPMIQSSPLHSPSPAPEPHVHEPEEYNPSSRLKRTYHPFINGMFHKYFIFSYNCTLTYIAQVVLVMRVEITSLKELHLHLELRKNLMTGLRFRVKSNSRSLISCTAERRCRKET